MLYTASYFEAQNHHGKLISISRSRPQNFNIPTLDFLAPTQELLKFWKDVTKTAKPEELPKYWEQYQNRFLGLLGERMEKIDQWLSTIDPRQDYTLLCWEKAGEYCHRNDVGQLLAARAPELWGGFDVTVRYQDGAWVQSIHTGAIGQVTEAKYIGDELCYRVKITYPSKRITWLFAKDMVLSAKPQPAKKIVQQPNVAKEREIELVQLTLV